MVIILSFYFVLRADKPKTAFQKAAGLLVSLDKTNENYPHKDSTKFRYLQIDNYPKPFELFVGKSAGDFKPKFENIEHLQLGNSVTIYFDETYKTNTAPVNNMVYFIDKGQEAIFIEGNSKKNLIYGIIIFSALFIPVLFILKKKVIFSKLKTITPTLPNISWTILRYKSSQRSRIFMPGNKPYLSSLL